MTDFSIVIPVKKGKHLLQKCIASILNQTRQNYEIIVLTDPTTNEDGTLDWLKSLQISNLNIIESDVCLNIQENWERILPLKKAKYFTILGYDDILYPNYIEVMEQLIQKYPDASLFQTHFDFINEEDKVFATAPIMNEKLNGAQFLQALLRCEYYIMATGYMMRSSDYDRVGGIPVKYPNLLYADFELWLRLTFLGYQVVSPVKCFGFRIHQSTTKTSSESTMLKAFRHLIDYFTELLAKPECKGVIHQHAGYFLQYNCNAMAYRLIKKSTRERKGLRVADLLNAFQQFALQLGLSQLNLTKNKTIRIASLIDRFAWSRNGYLLFKEIFPKPVVKSSFK
jgi:glycosyltransferase involved in cell wall biosynthesis